MCLCARSIFCAVQPLTYHFPTDRTADFERVFEHAQQANFGSVRPALLRLTELQLALVAIQKHLKPCLQVIRSLSFGVFVISGIFDESLGAIQKG